MAGSGSYVDVDEKNFILNTPYSIIRDQFTNAQEFAQDAKNRTDEYLDQLEDVLSGLAMPDTGALDAVAPPQISTIPIAERPGLSDLDIDTSIPAMNVQKPTLIDMPQIPIFDIPDIGISPPVWADITKPTLVTPTKPSDRPTMVQTTLPVAPTLDMPIVPTFAEILIPAAPEVLIPDFTAQVPVFDIPVPQGLNYEDPAYQSDIWVSLMAKILHDIENGGTGLAEDVELGIWNRALERAREERTKSIRRMADKFGSSGLRMNSGELTSALLELEADWARKMTELGYNISEEQAKLAQTNTHFIVEQGIKCEALMRDFFNNQNNRVLEAQKQIVGTNIELYKALLQEHNNRVEVFKAETLAYETKIKGATAKLEAFRVTVEGLKVSADIQSMLADIYTKQVQALETRVRLYATQLEASKVQLEVNTQNLQVYKADIDAYSASLMAEKLKFEIYEAELKGETSKADTYRNQIEAYTALVGAHAKRADVGIAQIEGAAKYNSALIEGYKADLQAYETQINSLVNAIKAKVSGFEAETAAYSAETTGLTAYYSAKESEMRVLIENANFSLKKAVATLESITQSYISLNGLKVEGYKGIAGVSAQLTAASLSGIHASASVGYSAGESFSESWNHSDQINESHSFDETPD
jgi:hypothetical protein